MSNQLAVNYIETSSLAVFLHSAEVAQGEAHPDTLEFLQARLHILFNYSVELNPNNQLTEIEEIVAYLLVIDLYLANRAEIETFQFAAKIKNHINAFMIETQTIAKENQSCMPAYDIVCASKPLLNMINKLLGKAANMLIIGKITAQEIKQIIGITSLVSNALHDLNFEYLEAPKVHQI